MRRRDCIGLIGGAAAWPLAAGAQQRERARRVGILFGGFAAGDPEGQARLTAFVQGLAERGWADGRNLRIEYRWAAGNVELQRKYAAELVALSPDVLLAGGNPAAEALQQATHTVPIVFGNSIDPVGSGLVGSLSRPGGNATGFMSSEFSLSAKLLELFKQIAPRLTRVMVLVIGRQGFEMGQFAAVQAVAPSLGIEVTPFFGRDSSETERIIMAFASGLNSGLLVTGLAPAQTQRQTIIETAARLRLPAVYSFRRFVVEGGLISYGADQSNPYRLAAGYVDRILNGEKPADLPVQAPIKFELVINLKTARELGLEMPATVLARADEVIE
jgi:putative tryptophan/tyrosine transport system substrate-binding protein